MKKIIVLSVCMVWLMTGCGVKSTISPNLQVQEPFPSSSLALGQEEAKQMSDKVPIHLYFFNEKDKKLALEVRQISLEDAKQSTSHLAGIIVKELIVGPKANNQLKPTIPAGVTLVEDIKVQEGVADVSLSAEYLQASKGDQANFEYAVYSVVNSLTELKDIHKVNFKIQGQELEKVYPSMKNKMPLERNTALLSNQSLVVQDDSMQEDITVNEILE